MRSLREECTQKLLKTAKKWGIELTDEETGLSPTLLVERLFSGVVGAK